MPKVVIELQANTQDAVNKIQQFARAQKDAFDAVKAANPAIADATVKVSKLTESTGNAAQATTHFNQAAKGLAQGGIRELAGGIPVVGNALSSLASTLKGFPGILLGVVGAGAAFISFLKSVAAEADKANKSIAQMSAGIQSSFMNANRAIAGMRGAAAGRPELQLVNQFDILSSQTNLARDKALADAQTERAGAITMTDRLLGLVNPQALLDKQTQVETAYQTKRKLIDQEANDTIRVARERLTLDLAAIEADLDAQIAAGKDTRVEAETTAQTAIQATIDKTAELAPAIQAAAEAAVGAGELWLRSMEGISQALDEIIAKTRAAGGGGGAVTPGAAVMSGAGSGGASGGGGTGPTGVYGLDFSVLGGITGQAAAAAPITNVTVNQTGTVIQQDRDWQTLVEQLKSSLGS